MCYFLLSKKEIGRNTRHASEEEALSVKVKGAVLLSRSAFVHSEFGKEAWERILATMSEENRKQLKGVVLSTSWYPFEVNEELDRTIVDVLGGGDRKIFKKIGKWSAQANLGGPHRAFLRPGDPAAFLDQTDRIYQFYYDTGRREYESTGPDSGVMTTYDAETFSENDCLTVIGWYEEALKMCGAKKVVSPVAPAAIPPAAIGWGGKHEGRHPPEKAL
jgi:hypothetical protein